MKIEDYKKRLIENEKKTKEYKKTIKKLSQKILEIQEKINTTEAKSKDDSMTKESTQEGIPTDEDKPLDSACIKLVNYLILF